MTVSSLGPLRFGSVSAVTATRGANDPEVGTTCQEGDEHYRYVYNAGNSQISVGQCATVSAVTGYSVTVSTTTSVDFAVGVCKHATLTTGTYGWLLTKGFGPAKAHANSGLAAGGILTAGADGVVADMGSIATGYVGSKIGKVTVATASGGNGEAFYCIF